MQVTEEPPITEEPNATDEVGITEEAAPAQTTEESVADVRLYATIAPDELGTGQTVAFDYTMTAGDRLIAILLTGILLTLIVHLILDLWGRPRGATFVAEE